MKKTNKILATCLCTTLALVSTITAFAATSYANYFETWIADGYYKGKFSFIADHEIQEGEPYCSEVGRHVKQAYVIAYNSEKTTGRKYSTVAPNKSNSTRRNTPTVSIKDTWGDTEYVKYGYTLFK